MPTNLPGRKPSHQAEQAGWILATASVPALVMTVSQLVPSALVLPAVGMVLVCLGFGLASWAWQPRMQEVPVRNRVLDLAALLVLMGFAASILADADQAIAALETLVASQETVYGTLQ